MKNNIGLIYTTFLRPELVKKTLPTILKYTDSNIKIFVADQGLDKDNIEQICNELKSDRVYYYKLPYDCGLSYARNCMVKEIDKMRIKTTIISADSIYLDNYLTFVTLSDFLWYNNSRGIVGIKLKDRVSWERDMDLVPNKHFNLTLPKRKSFVENGVKYIKCDIVKNFFIAKIKCLLDVEWDESLKLAEHEDYFYRLKQSKWEVYFTNNLQACYENSKPLSYKEKRQRLYKKYLPLLKKKYNISGWVKYEQGEVLCD